MIENVYFRYKEHPGDFFRDISPIELPNPKTNLEEFLVSFLKDYQGDSSVAYLDDLYKLLFDEFSNEVDQNKFIQLYGKRPIEALNAEIKLTEENLLAEAYKNFYFYLSNDKIEIIESAQK